MREGSLLVIVILSAMLFGAIFSWAQAIVALVTVVAFIFFLWKEKSYDIESKNDKIIALSSLLFFAYPLFQLVPLPLSLLSIIHPKLNEIVTISQNARPLFHSITLYPFATELNASLLFLYLAVFFMAAFGIRDKERTLKVIEILVFFAFFLGVFGLIQFATWNGKIYWFRDPLFARAAPFGPFVNKNHFAGFIVMIIPFSLGLMMKSGRIEKKFLYGFLGVVSTIALFFTTSRGGILSFLAGIVVFVLFSSRKGISKTILIPICMFVVILAGYLLFFGISPILERFAESSVTTDSRLVAWRGTLSAFSDYPVFGSGLGTFQHIFKVYQPEGLRLYWNHAHNDYLELLLELGIVGTLIVMLFFVVVLKTIIKTNWSRKDVYLGAAFLSSITTIAFHSIVDFNLHIPSNALLFSLILGLGVSFSREEVNDHRKQRAWPQRQL